MYSEPTIVPDGRVAVDWRIFDQIEAVRLTGQCNMANTHAVQRIADRDEHYALVIFIQDYRSTFFKGVFDGFIRRSEEPRGGEEKS